MTGFPLRPHTKQGIGYGVLSAAYGLVLPGRLMTLYTTSKNLMIQTYVLAMETMAASLFYQQVRRVKAV